MPPAIVSSPERRPVGSEISNASSGAHGTLQSHAKRARDELGLSEQPTKRPRDSAGTESGSVTLQAPESQITVVAHPSNNRPTPSPALSYADLPITAASASPLMQGEVQPPDPESPGHVPLGSTKAQSSGDATPAPLRVDSSPTQPESPRYVLLDSSQTEAVSPRHTSPEPGNVTPALLDSSPTQPESPLYVPLDSSQTEAESPRHTTPEPGNVTTALLDSSPTQPESPQYVPLDSLQTEAESPRKTTPEPVESSQTQSDSPGTPN